MSGLPTDAGVTELGREALRRALRERDEEGGDPVDLRLDRARIVRNLREPEPPIWEPSDEDEEGWP